MRKVLGIWSEEIDALADDQSNSIFINSPNELNLSGKFKSVELCDLIHLKTAKSIGVYEDDFYKGRPALTANALGNGTAYYVATRTGEDFNNAFYGSLINKLAIKRSINADLPYGVTAQLRTDEKNDFIFLMNFSNTEKKIEIDDCNCYNLISKEKLDKIITLAPYGILIIKKQL